MNNTSFKQSTKKGNTFPSNPLAKKKSPYSSLPLTPPTYHLKKTVKQHPSYLIHSATLPLSEPLTTTTTGSYLLIRSTYIIDPTYSITAFPNTINPLNQNMNLRTGILPHTLEYNTNKIPKHKATLPPIMITLISTTCHIRTT